MLNEKEIITLRVEVFAINQSLQYSEEYDNKVREYEDQFICGADLDYFTRLERERVVEDFCSDLLQFISHYPLIENSSRDYWHNKGLEKFLDIMGEDFEKPKGKKVFYTISGKGF